MDFLIDNWFLFIVFFALLAVTAQVIYRFIKKPSEEQMANLREWLLGAVIEVEKELGGGTGRLKLRLVYDLFVTRFPWLARVISFSTFSDLVDDTLEEMREMLAKNESVHSYVAGEIL